ncbi:MAG: MBL fold metallo-hydrolase [Pseudomonadales bacterium]|nr:MBL fold metallo-hydrolase [Pseudomonadales bacterium]
MSTNNYLVADAFPMGEITEIAEGLHVLRQPMLHNPDHINCYLIEGDKGLTIVDTGIPSEDCYKNWQMLLDSPLGAKGVERIYLTHAHPDHVGGAKWLQENTGAPIVMPGNEVDAVQRMWRGASDNRDSVAEFFTSWGVPEDSLNAVYAMQDGFKYGCPDLDELNVETFNEGFSMDIGGRTWKTVDGYGHTPHNAALFCEKDGIMISGDQVLTSIFPNVSIWWGSELNPLQSYMDSLNHYKTHSIKVIYPAHGGTLENVNKRIDAILNFNQIRLDRAVKYLTEAPQNAFEAIPGVLNKKRNPMMISLLAGQVFAIFNCLEKQGLIEKVGDKPFTFQTCPEVVIPEENKDAINA